jgi:hypothetical protein
MSVHKLTQCSNLLNGCRNDCKLCIHLLKIFNELIKVFFSLRKLDGYPGLAKHELSLEVLVEIQASTDQRHMDPYPGVRETRCAQITQDVLALLAQNERGMPCLEVAVLNVEGQL